MTVKPNNSAALAVLIILMCIYLRGVMLTNRAKGEVIIKQNDAAFAAAKAESDAVKVRQTQIISKCNELLRLFNEGTADRYHKHDAQRDFDSLRAQLALPPTTLP